MRRSKPVARRSRYTQLNVCLPLHVVALLEAAARARGVSTEAYVAKMAVEAARAHCQGIPMNRPGEAA